MTKKALQQGVAIDSATRTIYDVLYEANVPLHIDTIVERSFPLVNFAVMNHIRRVYLRTLQKDLRYRDKHRPVDRPGEDFRDGSVDNESLPAADVAWNRVARIRIRSLARTGRLIRNGDVYRPNPDSPPFVEPGPLETSPRRTALRLTREMWVVLRAKEDAAGQIGVMKTQINSVIKNPVLALSHAARFFRGEEIRLPDRERRFYELAITNESRAWLLHELVNRAYGA